MDPRDRTCLSFFSLSFNAYCRICVRSRRPSRIHHVINPLRAPRRPKLAHTPSLRIRWQLHPLVPVAAHATHANVSATRPKLVFNDPQFSPAISSTRHNPTRWLSRPLKGKGFPPPSFSLPSRSIADTKKGSSLRFEVSWWWLSPGQLLVANLQWGSSADVSKVSPAHPPLAALARVSTRHCGRVTAAAEPLQQIRALADQTGKSWRLFFAAAEGKLAKAPGASAKTRPAT